MKRLAALLLLLASSAAAQVARFPNCSTPAVGATSSTTTVFGCPAIAAELVSAWPLSADGDDAHGANDLTNNNGVTFVPLGPTGVVADFTAASSEYLANVTPSIPLSTNATWSFWAKAKTAANNTYLSYWSYPTDGAWQASIGAGTFDTFYITDAPGDIGNNFGALESGATVPGQWGHFVWVFDGSGVTGTDKLKCYFNGVAQTVTIHGTIPATILTPASNVPFNIGLLQNIGNAANDYIGRVGIWSRSFSPSDASALFNAGKGKSYADLTTAEKVGLVSYWNLDEASGNRADSHGSNTLTDNNTVGSFITGPSGVVAFTAGDDLDSLTSASNPFAAASAATVNFWLKYEAHHGNGSSFALDNAGPDRLFYHATSNGFWYVFDTTGAFEVVAYDVATNTGWHMITLTVDGAERKLRLYADGVLQATSAALANPVNFASAGFIDLSQSGQFSGKYANFGTWSTVIDGATITALFNGGKGKRYADLTTADKVGLLQYANFDEVSGNRIDSHGANDFTDNNAVGYTFNSYPANMPGTVANFVAASGQYFSIADNSSLDFSGTWTVSGWFNASSFAAARGFVSKDDIGANREFYSAAGAGGFTVNVGGGADLGNTNGGAGLTTDTWYLFTFWYDGTSLHSEINNANEVSAVSAAATNLAAQLWIGGIGAGFPATHQGRISSVLIWPTRVLTPTDRACLWKASAGGFHPFSSVCNFVVY